MQFFAGISISNDLTINGWFSSSSNGDGTYLHCTRTAVICGSMSYDAVLKKVTFMASDGNEWHKYESYTIPTQEVEEKFADQLQSAGLDMQPGDGGSTSSSGN